MKHLPSSETNTTRDEAGMKKHLESKDFSQKAASLFFLSLCPFPWYYHLCLFSRASLLMKLLQLRILLQALLPIKHIAFAVAIKIPEHHGN